MKKFTIAAIIAILIALVVTVVNGAPYPTVNAKAYDMSPHKGEMFVGCECCHGPDPCNSH